MLCARILFLSVALLGACGPTEVALVATSDLPVAQLAAVEIAVTSSDPSSAPQRRCVCLAGSCSSTNGAEVVDGAWPLTAGLRPGRSSDPPFTVELLGYAQPGCGGTPLLVQRARARFRAHRRLLLRMSLSAQCLSVACDALETTCREGSCVPIDFPLEQIDGADPLASLDLSMSDGAAGADLAGPDLSDVDLRTAFVRGTPAVVLTDATGVAGPPAIASIGTAYQLAVVSPAPPNTLPRLIAYSIDPSGMIGAPVTLYTGPSAAYTAPVTIGDGTRFVTQVVFITAGASVLWNDPGLANIAPVSSVVGMVAAQAIVQVSEGVQIATTLDGFVTRRELARPLYDPPVLLAPGAMIPSNGPALAMSRTALDDVAVWYNDSDGMLSVLRRTKPPAQDTLPLGASGGSNTPNLLAAAASDTHHFAVLAVGPAAAGELRYTAIPAAGAGIPAYETGPFDPPVLATPSSLIFVRDGSEFLLAYTDAAGLHERVYQVSTNVEPPQLIEVRVLPVLAPTAASEAFDGLSFVPGPLAAGPGAGRYAWRGRSTTAASSNVIYTMARDAARP